MPWLRGKTPQTLTNAELDEEIEELDETLDELLDEEHEGEDFDNDDFEAVDQALTTLSSERQRRR